MRRLLALLLFLAVGSVAYGQAATKPVAKGDLNVEVVIRIVDSADGTPETSVVAATAGLDLDYRREGETNTNFPALSNLASLDAAHTDGGLLHIGNGYYRLDVPDAAFATGAESVLIHGTATDMIVIGCVVPLADPINITNGVPEANVVQWNDTAIPAVHTAGYPIVTIKDGTGTGEIDTATGAVQTVTTALNVSSLSSAAIDAASFDTGAIAAATIAADVTTELLAVASGTADNGSTTTLVDAALTQGDNYWNDATVEFTDGTLAGVQAIVGDFDAATDTITFRKTLPAAVLTHTYRILRGASAEANLVSINGEATVVENVDLAQMEADTTAILADTNELQIDWVNGGRLDLILDARASQTSVDALNDLSAAEFNTEIDTALADIHLDHLLAVDYDPAAKPGVATALLNELVESDLGVSRFTVNALENAPSGSGASAEAIADAVWDEILSGHTTAGSGGKIVSDILVDTGTTLNDFVDDLETRLTATRANSLDNLNIGGNVASAASLATVATDATTIKDRLGAWAGTGRNTVLGGFQSLLRSDADATVPTDINADLGGGVGTANNTTDSMQAVRDRGDAAWITATGFSTHSAADVWAAATRTLTAGTNIVLAKGTGITGFNDLSTAQVNTEMDAALADINLDHFVGTSTGIPALPAGTFLDQLLRTASGTFDRETDSLEAIRNRGDAAWTGGGGGTADWTVDERTAIRSILGVPTSGTTPDDPTVGILDTIRDSLFDPVNDTVVNVTNVATLTGHTAQTGDSFIRLGAPVGASISADIQAIETSSGGGPIEHTPVPGSRTLMTRSRGDGTFGVVGRIRMRPGETLWWAVSLRGTQLAPGDLIDSVAAPTVTGAQSANMTVPDYGVFGELVKIKCVLVSGATTSDVINVELSVTPDTGETLKIVVPVTVGS